jgi:hypothetical protein
MASERKTLDVGPCCAAINIMVDDCADCEVCQLLRQRAMLRARAEKAEQALAAACAAPCGLLGDGDRGPCSCGTPLVVPVDWRARAEKAEQERDAARRELCERDATARADRSREAAATARGWSCLYPDKGTTDEP